MIEDIKYLEQLAENYSTIGKASTEIINLQSILNLPKGTEHFLSDIHGEYEAFSHVLRSGSGAVRKKIDDVFGHTLGNKEKMELATLIYYPKERIDLIKNQDVDITDWYQISLYRLIEVCKVVSSKYTRSKVRKALPPDYAYVIEELITEKSEVLNKEAYYAAIIDTILEIGCAEKLIIAISELIQRLVIDHLHVLGDIFDRGESPHRIMDCLCDYHSLDIQWGNHDVLWMGAAAGQLACIANVLRICIRYDNLDILEDGYGINLLPLATFALENYKDDLCECFAIKGKKVYDSENSLAMKMHKAITVIQFKIEGKLVDMYPDFHMQGRKLLDRIDYESGTVTIDGKVYPMKDGYFPTINPSAPYELTEQELAIMNRMKSSFMNCEKLQKHVAFLLKKGNLYKVCNGNLLYHGCIPMNADGTFMKVLIDGKRYSCRELYDVLEMYVRRAFVSLDKEEQSKGADILWYLWNAPESPLFGRNKMATFERYFLDDKAVQKEIKNSYYELINEEETADKILMEFDLSGDRVHIINGHVPVHQNKGENPVKCNGKVIVIDGGFSKAYHKETGIAGYTLTYNSYGMTLTAHEPFESAEVAITQAKDIVSKQVAVEYTDHRMLVGETDKGKQIKVRINELKSLIVAYRLGMIVETTKE